MAQQAPRPAGATVVAENQPAPIAEVIVTARKQAENLQRVPEPVTSDTGAQLTERNIRQGSDLSRVVPSLLSTDAQGSNASSTFTVRGAAPGDVLLTISQPVGLYEDTVNIPHPVGTNAAFFDLERVEVIAGPQGTLYGRNTTGGAIDIITRGADYGGYHGFLYGEAGNYDDYKFAAAVNIPLIKDVLSVRIADQYWYRQGFGQSSANGQRLGEDRNDNTFRLSVRFDPSPNFTSTTKFEADNLARHGLLITLDGVNPAFTFPGTGISPAALEAFLESGNPNALKNEITPNIFTNTSTGVNRDNLQIYHVVEDFTWTINDAVKLRSITGYHYAKDFQSEDLDSTRYQLLEIDAGVGGTGAQPITGVYPYPTQPDEQYGSLTQEFDLSGKAFDRLNWLVGAYGSTETGNSGQPSISAPVLNTLGGLGASVGGVYDRNIRTKVWGVYTQDDLHITDTLSITGGVRYSQENESQDDSQFGENPVSQKFFCDGGLAPAFIPNTPAPNNNPLACAFHSAESANGVSYLASINWQATPDILVYLKTAKGFKGGVLQERAPEAPPAKPEFATDYEIGFKGDFFDHRLRADLAAYLTDYTNKQQSAILVNPANNLLETVISNAATARAEGVEAQLTAVPVQGLTLYSVMDYLHGQYTKFGTPACNTATAAQAIQLGCPHGANGAPVDASGLPFALPPWQVTVGGRYEFDLGPGKLAGELDYAWRAAAPNSVLTVDPLVPTALANRLNEDIGLLNGRIDYYMPEQGLTFSLFSTNLLNKHYQTAGLDLMSSFGFITGTTQEPLMVAFSVRKTFGGGE
jgi:iron complex outermembrane receptor protein